MSEALERIEAGIAGVARSGIPQAITVPVGDQRVVVVIMRQVGER